jgi:fucose permease
MGLTGGVWMSRVPSAKAQAHLSDGTLGVALFAVPIGLVLGAAVAERLVDRVGSAPLGRICGLASCVTVTLPGLAHSLVGLIPGLFAVGVVGGTLDIAQNAQGVRVEAAHGRPVMSSMHAFYSLGAILGSLAGGVFAWAGVGLLPSLAAVGVLGALIDGAASPWLLPEQPRTRLADTSVAGISPDTVSAAPAPVNTAQASIAPVSVAPDAPAGPAVTRRDRRRVRRLVLALGVLGICGLVGEGAAGDWSAVYLKDNLGTSAGFASLGFAAFSVTMTLGRGVGDRLIHRFGVVAVIRCCGLIATAGLSLALATPVPALAIAGFTVFGAGLSVVVPQVFAAGGRADPLRPGSGLARVVGLGYTGMAAGPAIIGLVADKIGLHLALLIPVALAGWIAVAASALRPAPAAAAPVHGDTRQSRQPAGSGQWDTAT